MAKFMFLTMKQILDSSIIIGLTKYEMNQAVARILHYDFN